MVRAESARLAELSEAELDATQSVAAVKEEKKSEELIGPTPVKLARLESENAPDAPGQDEKELEEIRNCYEPRFQSYANRLPAGSYLFLPPNRYIFQGAEVFKDLDDSESDCSSSTSSSSCDTTASSSTDQHHSEGEKILGGTTEGQVEIESKPDFAEEKPPQ